MKTSEVRQSFIDYFKLRGHRHVASASLVPAADPTLLFTNAGMVQFKQVFQGLEKRDYSRAVTVQKCVRAGGKHNDLEQVGHTARHHTFFEMLGNFSFGDYFKREAIEYGWEWVTSSDYLGIDPDRVFISVHHTDDEARKLWHEITGISEDRIYGLGDKDNFWQMADTGPCGPCSEIFVDIRHLTAGGMAVGGSAVPALDEFIDLNEAGHLLEIWNLVFMQYDQAKDGSRTPLPAPSVDTGAGAERIAAVKQDAPSNFDTQLFLDIIKRGEDVIGKKYDKGPAGAGFRVLADHARAVAFLLADGLYPSNDGRGYVLRRILRRGVRHAYLLGRSEPTLVHMADSVVQLMGDAYPELREKASHIEAVTRAEEERFLETIEEGLRRLDEITVGPSGTVSGDDAFKLYDTYGFPVDLTEIIAEERGWTVDQAGFEAALKEQQERSRRAQKGDGGTALPPYRRTAGGAKGAKRFVRVTPRVRQRFVGYETTATETDIISYRLGDGRLALVLKENPFYAESGGQVSDTGVVKGDRWELRVDDVQVEDGKQVVIGPFEGEFEPSRVEATVDEWRRNDIARNHTATHLAHAALRKVLGDHVRQSGSVVAPDRLRFDFSHHSPVKPEEVAAIEEEVNRGIWKNEDVATQIMPYDDALRSGATALFGEKYADRVRCVRVPGISLELCGGTHVRTTGQIALFHITSESGIAAGVRRIEAVTGPGAYRYVKGMETHLDEAAEKLRTGPEHVPHKIEALLEEKKKLEKQVEELIRGGSGGGGGGGDMHTIGEVTVIVDESPVSDRAQVGLLMDAFRDKNQKGVKVVFTTGDRPSIFVAVTDDLVSAGVKAGELANQLAALSGGRGGGRPHFASSGVGDPEKVPETKNRVAEIVREHLAAHGLA